MHAQEFAGWLWCKYYFIKFLEKHFKYSLLAFDLITLVFIRTLHFLQLLELVTIKIWIFLELFKLLSSCQWVGLVNLSSMNSCFLIWVLSFIDSQINLAWFFDLFLVFLVWFNINMIRFVILYHTLHSR